MATYAQQQAENLLKYYQGMSGTARTPSALASAEEREAFAAQEVRAGRAPVEMLPEAYGGRPTGTSRRAIRMAAAYDEAKKQQLEQQRLMQQMDLEQRRLALSQRNQTLQERQEARLQAAEAKAQDEAIKVSEQADFALNEILGGFDPTGNPIAGLDPDAPDYMQRRNDIIKRYPKAIKDDAFKTAISTTDKSYFDKLNFDQSRKISETQQATGLAKELATVGKSIVDFTENGKINFEKANEAIGKAWSEGKEIAEERAQTEEQRKSISSRITDAEKKLLEVRARSAAAQRRVEARPTVKDFQTELEAAQIEQGILEDEINRLNRILGGKAKTQVQQQQAGGSEFQNTLERFEEVDKRIGPLFLERMKRLGVDSVDEGTVNTVLNITGLKDKGELTSALRDQSALDWANANPDDPRSQRIKQRLGVE